MAKRRSTNGKGLGVCARCARVMSLDRLRSDPNIPGLLVCERDRDDLDPYRLPPRQTESYFLPMSRPDVVFTAPPQIDWTLVIPTPSPAPTPTPAPVAPVSLTPPVIS